MERFSWLIIPAFIVFGIAQLVAGFQGISYELGAVWAYIGLAAALIFRFMLPITVGSFFGAMNVWGWPWYFALLFAAPGLAFLALIIPGALKSAIGVIRR
jgi:hypothetical protein